MKHTGNNTIFTLPKTLAIAIAVCTISFTALNALEVDVDEIQKGKRVKFINYKGRIRTADPVRGIYSIGHKLARGARKAGNNRKYRYLMKYSVVHAVSNREKGKFSADIISIDRSAKVGHIKNIRRILSGFYQSMYAYSKRHADTLAIFTTFYNAVHRGNLKYFQSKYKGVVNRHLNRSNAGLSTKYYEWPGRSRIVIPLTEQAMRGKLDAIDTDIISDKKVIDQMRKDDKHLKDRKDMIKMREKIAEKDKQDLTKKKDRLKDRKQQLQKEKQRTREKEQKIQREKEQTQQIKDKDKRKQKEREVARKEKQTQREKQQQKQEEEKIQREEEQVRDEEQQLSKKDDSIQEEKEQIRRDEEDESDSEDTAEDVIEKREKELDKREDTLRDKVADKNIYANKLYYLKIRDYLSAGHYNNELYMIDAPTKKIDFKSPITNICGRRYDIFSDGIVVITHQGSHTSGHRLSLIDRKSLKVKVNGTDNIFWRSFVEIREGHIFAIIKENNDYYLGKFNNSLKRIAKSSEKINENTFMSIFSNYIYINRYDKKIIVLDKGNLTLIGEIMK